MQLINKKKLEKFIKEAKAEGKDTSELENFLSSEIGKTVPIGEVKKFSKWVIVSTGPAREEDFEDFDKTRR